MARDPYSNQNWTGRAPRTSVEAFGTQYYHHDPRARLKQALRESARRLAYASPILLVALALIFF